jgi:hypothetical protein
MILSKSTGFERYLYNDPRITYRVVCGVSRVRRGEDKRSASIYCDIDDNSSQDVLNFLRASIIDSSKFSTKEDAMRHITTYVAYLYKYG